jgi:hypothetical protein
MVVEKIKNEEEDWGGVVGIDELVCAKTLIAVRRPFSSRKEDCVPTFDQELCFVQKGSKMLMQGNEIMDIRTEAAISKIRDEVSENKTLGPAPVSEQFQFTEADRTGKRYRK